MEGIKDSRIYRDGFGIIEVLASIAIDKIDELVEGYNESLEGVGRRWKEQISINEGLTEYCDRILKRLENHISKHKEYAEGGDPAQK